MNRLTQRIKKGSLAGKAVCPELYAHGTATDEYDANIIQAMIDKLAKFEDAEEDELWIDAENALPPLNERVLIFGRDSKTFNERTCIMFLSETQGWCNEQGYLYVGKVSHWMPIPKYVPK